MTNSSMRHWLSTASTCIALGGLAMVAPAQAQTQGPPDRPRPDSSPSSRPAPAPSASDADIVVTGIRASLFASADLKRNADSVIDAITAEDIGKFTDDNVIDALQRIPGVQVERDQAGTDGDRISIRGLGPQFVTTTVNGRALLSSGTEGLTNLRSVNVGAFPSEIVSGITVQKTPTATTVEPGLGGLADIQTLRPLSSRALAKRTSFFNFTARGEKSASTPKYGYRLSGAFGARNEDATLGAYVSAVYGITNRRTEQVNLQYAFRVFPIDDDGNGTADRSPNVFAPTALTLDPTDQNIERLALSSGIEAKLGDNWNLNIDATYTRADNRSMRNRFQMLFARGYAGTTPAANINIDANSTLRYFDYTRQATSPLFSNIPLKFDNLTTNILGGANLKYDDGRTRATFDAYYSSVKYAQDLRFFIFRRNNADRVGITFDTRTQAVPVVNASDENTDRNGYTFLQATVREIQLSGRQFGFAADFARDFDSFFSTLEAGARFSTTELSSRRTAARNFTSTNPASIVTGTIADGLTTPFLNSVTPFEPRQWTFFDYNRGLTLMPEVGSSTREAALGLDPLSTFGIREDVLSFYGQARLRSDGAVPFTGNIGLRATVTDLNSTGFAIGNLISAPREIRFAGSDFQLLPTLNLKFPLHRSVNLRFAVGRTLSRANYEDLAPRINVNPKVITPDPTDEEFRGASAGNPNLKPITSWNFDATIEYYPSQSSAFVASVFYKSVKDFIINQTVRETIDGFGGEIFDVTRPINFSDGTVKGFEVGALQNFTFLPAPFDEMGLQANYTYVQSKFAKNVGDAGFGFPGASKHNANLTVFYETQPLTVRLAYSYRSDYFRLLAGAGAQNINARFTQAFGQADLNIVVRPIRHISATFSINNLTNENRRDFIGFKTTFLDYFAQGRTFALSLRADF